MPILQAVAPILRRHAPAMSVALALHAAAAAAIHAGMQDQRRMRPEEVRTVAVELITLPQRIEPAKRASAPLPARENAASAKMRPAPSVAPSPLPAPASIAETNVPAPAAPAESAPQSAQQAVAFATSAAAPVSASAPRYDAAYLNNPKPAYPLAARRLGEEGTVLLHVRVSADGLPAKIEVRVSSGSERLDDAARDAVAQWRFVPAKQGGEAVAAWVLVPLVFRMNG